MFTSSALAKKYNLERYQKKPAELNELIFDLMLLQETIQLEHARKKKREEPRTEAIVVKRSAYGKFVAAAIGDGRYRYAVETALKASTEVVAVFQRKRFVALLRNMGIPEERIEEFCDTIVVEDDTHCADQD